MNNEQSQFIADAREIVEKLYRDLEQLRQVRSQGRQRRELAARIFRRVHTLKGSAGSLGIETVGQIAHELEGILDGVRLGRVAITDSVLDAFEDGANAIAEALESFKSEEPGADVVLLIERLGALAAQSRKQDPIAGNLRSALPPEIARSLSEYDLQHAREAVREGARLFVVTAVFAIDTFDQKFRELTRLLGQSGEVISTGPGHPPTPDEISFRLLYATELFSGDVVSQAEALSQIDISEIKLERSAASVTPPLATAPSSQSSAEATETVRIEVGQLSELISATSELFRYTHNAVASLGTPENKTMFDEAMRHLRRRFVELEERLIKLRLVPAGEVLSRAATRGGAMAARRLGKEVEFEIVGGEVGIDKSLADTIADPLLHLVRNAVTHGIESPAERLAAGKDSIGKITLAAFNEGSRIHITVTDDGRGIDWDRITAAAATHGIANSPSDLSPDQCLRLIFRPGFSTAADVSELSGRGIGLDVVDRAMEQAGGEVRVATQAGSGTTFAMTMPATLALVQCLLVQSGGQHYAIDASGFINDEVFDLAQPVVSNGHVEWQGESLPLISLSTLLGQQEEAAAGGKMIIWQSIPTGERTGNGSQQRYVLAVDGIKSPQETLVRSLGRHSARWPGVCGAAELFDGNVALVLDLAELIKTQRTSKIDD